MSALLTREELALRLKVAPVTVWRWARKGALPPGIQLADGTVRWSETELAEWISSRPRGVLRSRGGRR
jgi:predicted DNA-binding transcriptional regulator AlpA